MSKTLDSLVNYIDKKVAPPLLRVAENRYLVAARDGILATVPLTICGSIFLILAFPPYEPWYNAMLASPWFGLLLRGSSVTFGALSIFLAVTVAYSLAKRYEPEGVSPIHAGVISLVCFLASSTPTLGETGNFGSPGMLPAIILALLSTEVYRWIVKKGLYVRMPAGVPPFITEMFKALVPVLVVLMISWTVGTVLNINVPATITGALTPLATAVDSWPVATGWSTLVVIMWSIGVHPSAMLAPLYPFFYSNLAANVAAYAAGQPIPHVFMEQSFVLWNSDGGTGNALALLLVCFTSKSKTVRRIATIAFIPALFNINEPTLFGLPVALNPILMIPMWISGVVSCGIGYGLMYLGIVRPPVAALPWTVPPLIKGFFFTLDPLGPVAEVIVGILIPALIYYPFFKVFEKGLLEKEAKAAKAT